MSRSFSDSSGKTHVQLAAAFGVPSSGIVLEMNPVLPSLRMGLVPPADGADDTMGPTVFLDGYSGEGKGAQAFLIARDWLRLGEANKAAETKVLLIDQLTELEQLDSLRGGRRALVVVRGCTSALAEAAGADAFRRARQSHPSLAVLVLADRGLIPTSIDRVHTLWQSLVEASPSQKIQSPVWLEMCGIPVTQLRLHVQGRARLAGLPSREDITETILKLARIDDRRSDADHPRVLVGLIHRALDRVSASRETSAEAALLDYLRGFFDREMNFVDAIRRRQVVTLIKLIARLRAMRPWSASYPPADLVAESFRVLTNGGDLSELQLSLSNLFVENDGTIALTIPGLSSIADPDGPPIADESLDEAVAALEAAGRMSAISTAMYWLGRGDVPHFYERVGVLDEQDAWRVGQSISEPGVLTMLFDLPPALQAAVVVGFIMKGEQVPDVRDPHVWGLVVAASARMDIRTTALHDALGPSHDGDVHWWNEVLLAASRVDTTTEASERWLRLHPALNREVVGFDVLGASVYGPRRDGWISAPPKDLFAVAADATAHLCERGSEDGARLLMRTIVAYRSLDDLLPDAIARSTGTRWADVAEIAHPYLPLWLRCQLHHVRIHHDPSLLEHYPAWIEAELLKQDAVDDPAAWLLVNGIIAMAERLPIFGGVGDRLRQVRLAWQARDPISAFIAGEIRTRTSAEASAQLADLLLEQLPASAPLRLLILTQSFLAANAAASGFDAWAQSAFAVADRLLAAIGVATSATELWRRVQLSAKQSAVRAIELTPDPREAGRLSRQAGALIAGDRDMDAARLLDRALRLDPDSIEAILVSALLYSRAGKNERVQELLTDALQRLGPQYHLVNIFVDHLASVERYQDALGHALSLCRLSEPIVEIHRAQLHRTASIADRAGDHAVAIKTAVEFVQRYGASLEIYQVLARHLPHASDLPGDPIALLRSLIDRLPLAKPIDRLQLMAEFNDENVLSLELTTILRANRDRPPEWYRSLATVLPAGVDQLVLNMTAAIRADDLVEARALLEELQQVAPARTDLHYFSAAIHLRFAHECSKRGMMVQARTHLETAFAAFVRATWSGYAGAEISRLGAEILCLRLIIADRAFDAGDVDAARELVRVYSFDRPQSIRTRELSVQLDLAHFRNRALQERTAAIPAIVKERVFDLFAETNRLVAEFPFSRAGFECRYAVVGTIVGAIAAQPPEAPDEPPLRALLEELDEILLGVEPSLPIGLLYHGEARLRLADGLELLHSDAEQIAGKAVAARRLLQMATEAEPSAFLGQITREDRIRLASGLRRVDTLILHYDARRPA